MLDHPAVHSRAGVSSLYTGTLIRDLFTLVEKVQTVAALGEGKVEAATSRTLQPQTSPQPFARSLNPQIPISKAEQFPQPLCLRPADWNLALLLIIHAQLVRTLEPGYDLANPIYVHQIGTVGSPEQPRVQAGE